MTRWNWIREIEWYAVIAIIFILAGIVLATLISTSAIPSSVWVLAVLFGFAGVVSAVFSHRT